MNVDPAKSQAGQIVNVNKGENFLMICQDGGREAVQPGKDVGAVLQPSAGDLSNHERMSQYYALRKQLRKVPLSFSEMLNPDGGVDQYQDRLTELRLRGIGCNDFSVPPNRANLLAFSRAIRLSKPL